jgi:hypothetical protein
MNNHYHLILENSSGRMSDFFLQLNGQYGMIFRKLNGEQGYVFQSRYKSTLIQADAYLRTAIKYALLNPVRAGLVVNYDDYIWSSAKEYFTEKANGIVDSQFVNELFSGKDDFLEFMALNPMEELRPRLTRYGEILGSKAFEKSAFEKYDRRKKKLSIGWKRTDDLEPVFNPVEKVIWEYEQKIGYPVEELDISSYTGKRLRGELLVRLKDISGLKYAEIISIPPFDTLKYVSLGKLYKDAKRRIKMEETS